MQENEHGPLDKIVFECCRELLSGLDLEAQPRSRQDFPASDDLVLCGVMGFGGKQMRGALVLASTKEPLERTHPGSFSAQRDWLCELANQLMGRVKNRLLSLGVEILLATPAGLRGDNLCPSPARLRSPQVFAAAHGFMCVWMDCELNDGFELPATLSGDAEPAVREGETLLF